MNEEPKPILKSADEQHETPDKEVTFDDNTVTPSKEKKKKSLVGLSPSQDAKINMLKQMF